MDIGSGKTYAAGQEGVEGDVLEKADLEAHGNHVAEANVEVVVAGPEVRHGAMGVAGKFEAGGNEGGVEVEDAAELNLKAELGDGR